MDDGEWLRDVSSTYGERHDHGIPLNAIHACRNQRWRVGLVSSSPHNRRRRLHLPLPRFPFSSSSSIFFYFVLFCLATIIQTPAASGRPSPGGYGEGRRVIDAGYGFEEIGRFFSVEDGNVNAVHYRHKETGADFVSVSNRDPRKFFAIGLKTLPSDDYGAAHVLEHSVLSGSEKYPVHNMLQELNKVSFCDLNAYTSADYTAYYGTSTNAKDLYNMLDVWWDGIFHPLVLKEEFIFLREAWNYNLESPSDNLTVEGVVMDEMKWSYADDISVRLRAVDKAAFPNTPYAYDYGGNPFTITNLTYSELKNFYKKFYHPSNSFIVIYGDDNPTNRLQVLGDLLSNFTFNEVVRNESALQPMTTNVGPRRVNATYLVNRARYPSVFVSWVLDIEAGLDMEKRCELALFSKLLPGFFPDKFLTYGRISPFVDLDAYGSPLLYVEFQNTSLSTSPTLEDDLMEILEALSRTGLPKQALDDAQTYCRSFMLNELEYSDSRGADLFYVMAAFWKRQGDPLRALDRTRAARALEKRIMGVNGKYIFSELLQELIISHNNRIVVDLTPSDVGVLDVQAAINEALAERKKALGSKEISKLVEKTKALDKFSRPKGGAANSVLPALSVQDLSLKINKENDKVHQVKGLKVVENYLDTNGFFYVDVVFNLGNFPQDNLSYAVALSNALLSLQPTVKSGVDPTEFRKSTTILGISSSLEFFDGQLKEARGEAIGSAYLKVSGKAFARDAAELVNLIRILLTEVELNNSQVFSFPDSQPYWSPPWPDFLLAEQELRLGAKDSIKGWFRDSTNGYRASEIMRTFVTDALNPLQWPRLLENLRQAYRLMVHSGGASISLIGDLSAVRSADEAVTALAAALPSAPVTYNPLNTWTPDEPGVNESVPLPLLVYSNARSRNVYKGGWRPSGSGHVITRVQSEWINTMVRARKHAYGGGASFDESTGLIPHLSWADPRILKSLQAFDDSAKYLESMTEMDEDLERVKAAVLGKLNDVTSPHKEGCRRFVNLLTNVSSSDYERRNREILEASLKDFREFGAALAASEGYSIIAASEAALAGAVAQDPSLSLVPLNTLY